MLTIESRFFVAGVCGREITDFLLDCTGVRRIHMPGEPDSPDTVSFIRTLPEAESLELLDAAIVGRVGFVAMRALAVYE